MRILIDTNVLVAAFTAHGTCAEVFEHCARRHSLVTSEYILDELKTTLLSPKFELSHQETIQVVHLVRTKTQIVVPEKVSPEVYRDPKDLPVLGSASAGGCQCLITGDKGLLQMKRYQNIDIISVSGFWKYERKEFDG